MNDLQTPKRARISRAVYDPPIRETIKRGDLEEMKAMLAKAKGVRARQGDLDAAIVRLEDAIHNLS